MGVPQAACRELRRMRGSEAMACLMEGRRELLPYARDRGVGCGAAPK